MSAGTAESEKRRGVVWLIIGLLVLGVMCFFWWLVARTNSEGDHDAELLPILALVPLVIGGYHLVRSRMLQG